ALAVEARSAGDAAGPRSETAWPVVWVIVAAGIAGAFQVGKMPPAIPALRAELGISLVEAGWVVSVFSIVGVASGMVAGAFADRAGHRRILLIGAWLMAAGSAAGAFADGFAMLLVARTIEGSGFIAVITTAPLMIAGAAAPRHGRLVLGIWTVYMPT